MTKILEKGPAWLSIVFMILALGLRHYPDPMTESQDYQKLEEGIDHIESQRIWVRHAMASLEDAQSINVASVESIQASLLLVVYSSTGGFEETIQDDRKISLPRKVKVDSVDILRSAITQAQRLQLHRVDDTIWPAFEGEMARRIWWSLCYREWILCSADPILWIPCMSSSDFITRLPGNYDDDDLHPGQANLPPAHPKDEFHEMSYVLCMLEYVQIVEAHNTILRKQNTSAEQGEGRGEEIIDAISSIHYRYTEMLENLPIFFRIDFFDHDSIQGSCSALLVQKWLLQSAIFSR